MSARLGIAATIVMPRGTPLIKVASTRGHGAEVILHGDGYDVMRGVVSTDTFFATPAVFRVHREGVPIRVPEGAPLLRVIPVPRSLLAAEFKLRRL